MEINIDLENFFKSDIQSRIKTIYSNGMENFAKTKIEINGINYYLEKVAKDTLLFCKVSYFIPRLKAYLQPIVVTKEEKAFIYPTYYDYYNDRRHFSNLKICRHTQLDRILFSISSIEIMYAIQENAFNLLNGRTVTAQIDDISFTTSDLFNVNLCFHSLDGEINYGNYEYSSGINNDYIALGEFTFSDDYYAKNEAFKRLKMIANANEIKLV